MKRIRLLPPLVALVAVLGACERKASQPPAPKTVAVAPSVATSVAAPAAKDRHDDPIAWRRGDVDAAFAEARAANKPVFLYWGAGWCPPCNQMKATLFRKREFVERTRSFVPVYVDGDTPAAQVLGTRFSVSGYPTMVLFAPDGTEITRLPGEAEPDRYLQVLATGMSAARPVRSTLAAALGGREGLTADDWRMLAWYSWDTDDQRLVATADVPAMLRRLATLCPTGFDEARARLQLKATAAADDRSGRGPTIERDAMRVRLEALLAEPRAARENFDLLTSAMPRIVRATTAAGTAERARVVGEADRVLTGLAADASLSNTDRLGATLARVRLATLEIPAAAKDARAAPVVLADALRDAIRAEVARADRESADPYERQTVIDTAADLLASAGLLDESDALLTNELARSHSPYYFMLDLASNARKRGDKAVAIDWYAKAYDAARGPATRLQWGATYVGALIDLSPDDAARIEDVARRVIGEVEPAPGSFDGRNRKSLSRLADRVAAWNANGRHAREATRVAEASRKLCDRLPATAPERLRCGESLKLGSPARKTPGTGEVARPA